MSNKKVMLITGTRAGIGRFLSEHYANLGLYVIGCSRGESALKHENYRHFSLDVSNEESVCEMFYTIRKELGTIHYLINNAGVASMNHCLLTPAKVIHTVFNTNVVGTYLMCREAAKLMRKNKSGRIVNFGSVGTRLKIPGESVYLASKAAIVGLTEVLAVEFAELGITVNAIGPTPMRTDLIKNVPEDKIQSLLSRQPIKRLAENSDIVNLIDFFTSPASDLVSGQIIYLGGV